MEELDNLGPGGVSSLLDLGPADAVRLILGLVLDDLPDCRPVEVVRVLREVNFDRRRAARQLQISARAIRVNVLRFVQLARAANARGELTAPARLFEVLLA